MSNYDQNYKQGNMNPSNTEIHKRTYFKDSPPGTTSRDDYIKSRQREVDMDKKDRTNGR